MHEKKDDFSQPAGNAEDELPVVSLKLLQQRQHLLRSTSAKDSW